MSSAVARGVKNATQSDLFRKHFLGFKVKDADKGLIEACFATTGVKDHDNDFTLPGAFEDGAEVVISAYGHKSWMGALPVGQGKIRVDGSKAILEGEFFLDTESGKETFAVLKRLGQKQEWSYGFDVLETGELDEEMRQKGVWRVIKKVKVYEVSPVLVGAGVDTHTLSVKKKPAAPADPAPTPEQKAADAALATEGRKQFVRFQKTLARLAVGE